MTSEDLGISPDSFLPDLPSVNNHSLSAHYEKVKSAPFSSHLSSTHYQSTTFSKDSHQDANTPQKLPADIPKNSLLSHDFAALYPQAFGSSINGDGGLSQHNVADVSSPKLVAFQPFHPHWIQQVAMNVENQNIPVWLPKSSVAQTIYNPPPNQAMVNPKISITQTTPHFMKQNQSKSGKYVCTHCSRSFTRLYNLKSHLRTHESHRPFECEHCRLTFARNHDLNRHLKTHSQEKPHVCQDCGRSFTRRDALRRHEKMNEEGKKMHCNPSAFSLVGSSSSIGTQGRNPAMNSVANDLGLSMLPSSFVAYNPPDYDAPSNSISPDVSINQGSVVDQLNLS